MPGRKNAPRHDGHGPDLLTHRWGVDPLYMLNYTVMEPPSLLDTWMQIPGYTQNTTVMNIRWTGVKKSHLQLMETPLSVVLYQLIRRSSARNSKKEFQNFRSTGKLLESSIMISESSLSRSGRFKTDFSGLYKQALHKKFKATSSWSYFLHPWIWNLVPKSKVKPFWPLTNLIKANMFFRFNSPPKKENMDPHQNHLTHPRKWKFCSLSETRRLKVLEHLRQIDSNPVRWTGRLVSLRPSNVPPPGNKGLKAGLINVNQPWS